MKKTIGITILLFVTIAQQGLAARKIVLDARVDDMNDYGFYNTDPEANINLSRNPEFKHVIDRLKKWRPGTSARSIGGRIG
jgi:hypothetical protein